MTRTQIYLPEETHTQLIRLAKQKNTTLSQLIREGAQLIVKKHSGKKSPQQKALEFFANPPKKYRIPLTGKQIIDMIRAERDDD